MINTAATHLTDLRPSYAWRNTDATPSRIVAATGFFFISFFFQVREHDNRYTTRRAF